MKTRTLTLSERYTMLPLAGAAATALLLVLAACGGDARGASVSTETPEPPTPVRIAPITDIGNAAVVATGTLGAKDEVPLAFKIGGVITRLTIDAGERVRAGQVLAELDLREIDAGVAKATAGAEKARRDATRIERLYNDSVATMAQWQDAQTARDVAEADLRAARMNREYAVITAPTSGVVLERLANAGSQIASGSPVLVLGSTARGVVFRAGLADRDVVRVRAGNDAVVSFDALPGRDFRGTVRQIGADADPRTGTYTIEVALSDASDLPNGLVGRVRIGTRASARPQLDGVSAIPAEALVEGDKDRGVVFVMDATQSVALRREVILVGVDGDRVLVRGLDRSTHVVTSGAAWLRDSTRVEVRP